MSYNFDSVELKQDENGELQVILHMKVPKNAANTEFGMEFNFDKVDALKDNAIKFVKKQFPKLKIASIAVVAGTLLLTSIPMQKAEAHEADFNMSYLYFGNTSSYISQVDKTQGNLNLVSPSYFDLNTNGSLKLTSQLDSRFVTEMHNRGIKVVPFLSNHWDRTLGRAALANREQLSTEIANAIIKYNLDGVQVDIENTTDVDRAAYTDLVRLLREKIPAGKEVSVAVAANPNGWTKGWHGSYDYKELSKYASYLMIMAYDESYEGSEEGPVASIGFVDRSIQYALNQGVPADKVVLGVPFYGRYWKEGATSGGAGISNTKVDEMLAKYGGSVVFDEASKSPKATITIKSGDPTTVVGGKTLAPGTYHIWFENNDSIREKLRLVHKYEIKGTGSWSLGQENASMWQYYKTWMSHDGVEVVPVNSSQPKEQTGIISPTPTTSYTVKSGDTLWKIATANNMSVDELKTLNGLTSDVVNIGQVIKVSSAGSSSSESTVAAPAIQTINYTVKSGDSLWKISSEHNMSINDLKTINGLTSDNINIGQVLKVKSAASSNETTSSAAQAVNSKNPFKDIGSFSPEVQQNILNLVEQNIVKGKTETTFAPGEAITRGQVAIMLGRLLVNNGYAEVPADWEKTPYFKDLSLQTKDRELLKYAAVVKASGVFNGGANEILNPYSTISRENMALVLDRATEAISGQSLVEKAKDKKANVVDLSAANKEAQSAIRALNALGISNVDSFNPKGEVSRANFASFLSRGMQYMSP
ncbi:glycosyl hydrolase family 18 protein [Lysinibacillus fusiformis]|nr:glycosyl hydrolase family 18 protein [Lysinibacillus fusiformis]